MQYYPPFGGDGTTDLTRSFNALPVESKQGGHEESW